MSPQESEDQKTSEDDESDIDAEFRSYLNEENNNNDDAMCTSDEESCHQAQASELTAKLKQLEEFDFESGSLETLRRMAIEKYGFVNKKYRRKAWPILILDRKALFRTFKSANDSNVSTESPTKQRVETKINNAIPLNPRPKGNFDLISELIRILKLYLNKICRL